MLEGLDLGGFSMAITDAVSIVTLAPPANFFDARWVTDEATCGESERNEPSEVCLLGRAAVSG